MESNYYELTNPQKNIWNTEMYFSNTNVNNICTSALFKDEVDIDLLREAINELVKIHDSFRIKLTLKNSVPMQYFEDYMPFNIDCVTVNNMDEFKNLESEMVNEKFKLLDSQLYKFKLVKIADYGTAIILNLHHMIGDSWSLGKTIQDIVSIYKSIKNNTPITEEVYSYKNFIAAEQQYEESPKYHTDKEFWENTLKDLPNPVSFYSPVSVSNVESSAAGRDSFSIEKSIMDKINFFCSANRISTYIFFMSVFSIYLANTCNTDDVIFGTPIINRLNYKDKQTTGMFISTIPFRIKITDNNFLDFATKNNINLLSTLRHQKYAYSDIVEDVRKDNPDVQNLYNVAISYQVTKTKSNTSDDCETNWIFNNNCLNDINIHLHDFNETGNLKIDYDYLTSKYTAEDIVNHHNRILSIINQVLDNPELAIKDVQIVTEKEKYEILNIFNNRSLDCPLDSNVIALFEKQVADHPDTAAVTYKDVTLSYRELNTKVNQFARFLQDQGIKKNDIVGVYMNKTEWFIISILALQKLGAAYAPMHPEYPLERVSYIMDDCKSKILITDNKDVDLPYPQFNPQTVDISSYDSSNLNIKIEPNTLCYVIYTSGSTGKPKGVLLSHKNLINFLYNFNDSFDSHFTVKDNCLSLTNISFDVSVCEIYTALSFGSRLVLFPDNTLDNLPLLAHLIENEKITYLYLPPNILKDIYNFIKTENIQFTANKLLVGVEAIKNQDLNNLLSLNHDLEIINGYGPTETTICITFFKYTYNYDLNGVVPIGFPLKNNNLFVVNQFHNLLPIGIPGELIISGPNVSFGYINNKEKTQKAFVKCDKYNSIFYKTGDNVYWSTEGYLNFIGRQDSQVKFRGHRIELTEINDNIKNIPGVTNSITQLKDVNGILSLCSYVATTNNTENTIKLKLSSLLPYYMIPNHIVIMNRLPVNNNGKIDKKALPEIKLQSNVFIAPTTENEKYLAGIVSKLINLENISIDSDFFNIGLDSLSAIRLSAEIYNDKFITLSIKDIFENNTISKLAKLLDQKSVNNNNTIITKCEKQEYYPLSSAQKRIYYTTKMIGNNTLTYNLPGALLVDTILNKTKVERCFNQIIAAQSSFRTSFSMKENAAVQIISDNVKLKVDTFTGKSYNMKKIISDFAEPFDLEQAPLLRVSLCYLENNKTLLLIDSHHIIMDGYSLLILIDEFCKAYNNSEVLSPNIEYIDYSVWENDYIKSGKDKEDEDYWINKFSNREIPTLNLPYDHPIPSTRSFVGTSITKKFSEREFQGYLNFSRKMGVSPYMFFLSAFFILLYKYSGQNEILVGSPTAGRTNKQLENIIGMFVNNLVLDSNIDSSTDYKTYLNSIKTEVLDSISHENYPYDKLVKKLNLPPDNSKNPLFDVMFAYQEFESSNLQLNNQKAKILHAKPTSSKFNLSLEINSNAHNATIEYCTDLFNSDTIERFFSHFKNTLDSIIDNPNQQIKNIVIMSETEKSIIEKSFNNTKLNYPKHKTLVNLFAKIVDKYPNNIAVEKDGKSITYKELDLKSNALANKLIDMGIKFADPVGVCLNKSIETIISIWALLKIGAIYIPMYVDFPDERLDYILENSNSKLLITSTKLNEIHHFKSDLLLIDSFESIEKSTTLDKESTYSNQSVAYIIYTSGSTGRPKGVQISHKNLINFIYSFKNLYQNDITPQDNFLSSTNVSFDVSIFEFFLPILNGSKLVLYTEEIIKDIIQYCNSIINNNITALYIPPNILNEVYNILKDSTNININKLLVGVEAIRKSTLNKYLKLNPDMKIVNGYGPTETTICCTALQYSYDDSNDDIVSIGRPLNNDQVYILDKDHNMQPIGITGNLYVSGDGVGLGYINNPEETDKNYLNNFINNNSPKLYNTGDLAKWNSDGTINFIGRNDSQVKISGHRIELKEINYAIMQYPNITKAYTTINKKGAQSYIISYFIAENDIQIKDLLTFLKSKLANYMIPNFIKQLESFPLTVNGKIDKTKLPDMKFETKKYVAPRNEFEKKIISIWQKLFLLDKIGIDDNFFELGGDSLTAIKFQIEAMNAGLNISYSDIFSHPTTRELSEINVTTNEDPIYNVTKNYDYDPINNLVSKNTIENIYNSEENIRNSIKDKPNINALLVGSTGFLGAHILDNFLSTSNGKIYCLIRKKSLLDPEERLRKTLNFYFGDKYDNEFNNRIVVVNGDIINKNLSLSADELNDLASNIDVVIHSAALVKHYGSFEQFNGINVLGTQNVIDFCIKFDKKLYYASTLSIAGISNYKKTINYFSENNFYVNQNLNNVYLYTKFEAEKLIYENILNNKLSACVLRIGNITNRYSDGKFQINASENAFVNRIKSILKLGVIQNKFLEHAVEFSPVDLCAEAIMKIIYSNPEFTTFHIYNNQFIRFDTLLAYLNSLDIHLKPVSDEEFSKTVTRFLNSDSLRNEISGIITDLDKNKLLSLINNTVPTSEFTTTYLKLINFEWPKIDIEYLKKYIKYFNSIKYIE